MKKLSLVGTVTAAALLSGCAAIQAQKNANLDGLVGSGQFEQAATVAEKNLGLAPGADQERPPVEFKEAKVLDHLHAASFWRLDGDLLRALAHLDAAEQALQDVDLAGAGDTALRGAASLVGNDMALHYRPSPAESVLINYTKALIFLEQGDRALARVELNRADDRTRRAVEQYAKEIEEAIAEAEEEEAKASYEDEAVQSKLGEAYADMQQWQPYAEFVVPPATYLQALFLSREGDSADRNMAADRYKRLVGLIEDHEVIRQEYAEASKGRVCPKDNCVWIIAERGLGPVLEETRVEIFVPGSDGGPVLVGLALPKFESRAAAAPAVLEIGAGGEWYTPTSIGSMDRVVQTEFKQRFPGVVTRAIVSSTARAIAQNEIQKRNPLMGLVSSIASSAVTAADTRMWRAMPGEFELARLEKSGDTLVLRGEAGDVEVAVPAKGSHLLYVHAPVRGVAPSYQLIEM